jgi:hypothetical protein
MGQLSPIVCILRRIADGLGDQLLVSNTITTKFIRHDLPGIAAVAPHQSIEETLGRRVVTAAPFIWACRYTPTTSPS